MRAIESAKKPEARARRIEKAVAALPETTVAELREPSSEAFRATSAVIDLWLVVDADDDLAAGSSVRHRLEPLVGVVEREDTFYVPTVLTGPPGAHLGS